ncbi:transposon-encoded TnpW family protein [Ruminococcaceae bacterium OttesenSCG-928-L11]|nr:transposon-encoded TnpW family protein [Ruminococcaceae bacterium OttesenSCG-928-L11]
MIENKIDYINRNEAIQDQYTPHAAAGQSQPTVMLKRIGSTTYRVAVHFSQTGSETMNDKILRLIRNEAEVV